MYQSVTPLSSQQHRNLRLLPADGYDYARGQTRVPIGIAELTRAAAFYPIVFLDSRDRGPLPHALLGLSEAENLFVDGSGRWLRPYVPMAIARYPFVLARNGPDTYALSIDDNSKRFSTSEGEPLFDSAGQMSDLVRRILAEQTKLAQQLNQSAAFGAELERRGLLRGVLVNLTGGTDGDKLSLAGMKFVDEKAFQLLPDDVVLAWWRSGYLALIHAHLLSIGQIQLLAQRKFAAAAAPRFEAEPIAAG